MLPSNAGSYQARPKQWAIAKSKNGALELSVEFSLFGFWDGDQWVQENSDIVGYFYLVSKEGKISERQIETVEDVFGWNRADGTQWFLSQRSLPDCQVALDFEEYNGQQRIKVKWLNAFDREPFAGVKPSDPAEVKTLDAKYGSLFRATARKAPQVAAKPQRRASQPPSGPNPLSVAKQEAWSAFKRKNAGVSDEMISASWKSAVKEYFGDVPVTQLGADHFYQFLADDFKKIDGLPSEPPLDPAGTFKEEEIPF